MDKDSAGSNPSLGATGAGGGGAFGSLFRSTGPTYSNSELAGVPRK